MMRRLGSLVAPAFAQNRDVDRSGLARQDCARTGAIARGQWTRMGGMNTSLSIAGSKVFLDEPFHIDAL
jgi:hypothetical protein